MALTSTNEIQDNLDVEVESLKQVTVASGSNLLRGQLVKLTSLFAVAAAVAGTNTGNGTVSTPTVADTASVGTFSVIFTAATTFDVYDPRGFKLKSGATGVAYTDQLGFTITAGGTPFIAGDSFTFAVTKNATPVVVAFTAGSDPYTVMYDSVDATLGAKVGRGYREACLKASEVNYGTGTLAEVRDALDMRDIHLVD